MDLGADWMLGASLHELPALQQAVARFAPLSVNEASVERKHALMNMELDHGNSASAPRLSLVSRLPELKRRVFHNADYMLEFLNHARRVYHPLKSTASMGIGDHPHLQPLYALTVGRDGSYVPKWGSTFLHAKKVKQVVYHVYSYSDVLDLSRIGNDRDGGDRHDVHNDDDGGDVRDADDHVHDADDHLHGGGDDGDHVVDDGAGVAAHGVAPDHGHGGSPPVVAAGGGFDESDCYDGDVAGGGGTGGGDGGGEAPAGGLGSPGPDPPPDDALKRIRRGEALRALRDSVDGASGTYYSIDGAWLRAHINSILPLTAVLLPQPPDYGRQGHFDVRWPKIFFKIVRASPKKLHTDIVDRSTCAFQGNDVAVTIHEMLGGCPIEGWAKVSLTSFRSDTNPSGMWVLRDIDCTQVLVWRSRGIVDVGISADSQLKLEPARRDAVIQAFHDAHALPGQLGVVDWSSLSDEVQESALVLEAIGFATRSADGNSMQLMQLFASTICGYGWLWVIRTT